MQPPPPASPDEALAERFARIFQRPPDPLELKRFRRAEADLRLRIPRRARRRAALLVSRM